MIVLMGNKKQDATTPEGATQKTSQCNFERRKHMIYFCWLNYMFRFNITKMTKQSIEHNHSSQVVSLKSLKFLCALLSAAATKKGRFANRYLISTPVPGSTRVVLSPVLTGFEPGNIWNWHSFPSNPFSFWALKACTQAGSKVLPLWILWHQTMRLRVHADTLPQSWSQLSNYDSRPTKL